MPAYDRRMTEAMYWAKGPIVDGVRQPGSTYSRSWAPGRFQHRADQLIELGVSGRVLVVGCGFGFLLEPLLDAGVDVVGCEPGPFFWEPVNVGEWRRDVRERVSAVPVEEVAGVFDWVVDEDAAPAADDVAGFLAVLGRLGRVVHFVTAGEPGGRDSSHTWLPLDEWRRLAPGDVWLEA